MKLLGPPRFSRADIAWTLIPALLWLGGIYGRTYLLKPHCASAPQTCTVESVNSTDRIAIQMESGEADGLSFAGQNISGITAITVPFLWHVGTVALGQFSPLSALIQLGGDWLLLAQASAWNGVGTELSHLVSQRPRPFVYSDPSHRGADPAHYTSFYSGHTSFAAVSMMTLILILLSRGAPGILVLASVISTETLVMLTGYARIMAGRHFLTDVLAAAVAGTLIAVAVAYRHR